MCQKIGITTPTVLSMAKSVHLELSRRERQIVDAVYRRGRATAAEITADIPDPPTSTAVRTMLRILEDKGVLRHEQDGVRYIYLPTRPHEEARRSALMHVVSTFFGGSPEEAMATLIDLAPKDASDSELERLETLIADARRAREVKPANRGRRS